MDKDLFEKAAALRHEIHKYPDLSNEERPTLERVMKFLKENTTNIEIHDEGHYVVCLPQPPSGKDQHGFSGRLRCAEGAGQDRISLGVRLPRQRPYVRP